MLGWINQTFTDTSTQQTSLQWLLHSVGINPQSGGAVFGSTVVVSVLGCKLRGQEFKSPSAPLSNWAIVITPTIQWLYSIPCLWKEENRIANALYPWLILFFFLCHFKHLKAIFLTYLLTGHLGGVFPCQVLYKCGLQLHACCVVCMETGQELVLKPTGDVFSKALGSSMVISCSLSQTSAESTAPNNIGLHWIDPSNREVTTRTGR